MSLCPYGDCPSSPNPCRHWLPDSHGGIKDYTEPCEACYAWTGYMQSCTGECIGHTDRQWKNRIYGPNWEGRPLLHKGRKP